MSKIPSMRKIRITDYKYLMVEGRVIDHTLKSEFIRTGKVQFKTSGNEYKSCSINVPNAWIEQMGINEENAEIEKILVGNSILIKRILK